MRKVFGSPSQSFVKISPHDIATNYANNREPHPYPHIGLQGNVNAKHREDENLRKERDDKADGRTKDGLYEKLLPTLIQLDYLHGNIFRG